MKTSRFKHSYRKSASKLHRTVGDFLRSSDLFQFHEIYQEYPVVRVNRNYSETRHHFDWVIPSLKTVVECHGEQHFEPVAFGGDDEKAVEDFHAGQRRDEQKKTAAMDAGYLYIVIPYQLKNKLTDDVFDQLMYLARQDQESYNGVEGDEAARKERPRADRRQLLKTRRKEYLESPQHQVQLRKAREYRKAQYQRAKELKKQRDARI